jgi:hypothetical protein
MHNVEETHAGDGEFPDITTPIAECFKLIGQLCESLRLVTEELRKHDADITKLWGMVLDLDLASEPA